MSVTIESKEQLDYIIKNSGVDFSRMCYKPDDYTTHYYVFPCYLIIENNTYTSPGLSENNLTFDEFCSLKGCYPDKPKKVEIIDRIINKIKAELSEATYCKFTCNNTALWDESIRQCNEEIVLLESFKQASDDSEEHY